MIVAVVTGAAGRNDVKVDVVDKRFFGAGSSGIVRPGQGDRQVAICGFFKGVGERLSCPCEFAFKKFHPAVRRLKAFLDVDMPVPFHVVRPEIRHFLEIGILSGIERAAAGYQDRLGQGAVGFLHSPVLFQIFPDDSAASGRKRRRHGGAAGGVIIFVPVSGLLSAVAGGHDAGAGNDHVRLHAAVGAGTAAGEAGQALVHAVIKTALDGGAGHDGVLGSRLVVQLGGRFLGAVVVVAGGMANQKILVLPHQIIFAARAAAVASAAARTETAVHDAGAGVVHDLKIFLRAGKNTAARRSCAKHVKGGVRRHAAVKPVTHFAVPKRAAGHVAAVAAGVAPVVIAAPLVRDGRGAAADDHSVMARIIRIHVLDPAVVKTGVLDADHLPFAAVSFHMQGFQVRHGFGPDAVAFRHRDLVFLDEANFRKLSQSGSLSRRHSRNDSGLEGVDGQFVIVYSHRFQFLGDDFPVLSFYGADQDLERLLFTLSGHAVRKSQLIFRQIRSEVREFKARLEVT